MRWSEIVFIRITHFYLTAQKVWEREDPSGALAVVKDGLVLDASKEAERWGVKPSHLARQADRRCPGLETIECNPDDYLELYERVWNVFAEITPLVEPIDYHRGYLDLTGCELHSGCKDSTHLIHEATQKLFKTTSLRCSWGGGQDKWIAKLASNENRFVNTDDERVFLEQVPVKSLGIPDLLSERFRNYSIHSVGQLIHVPDSFLQSHLQLSKEEIQRLRLRDTTPVRALFPATKLEDREILLWADDAEIESALRHLSERLTTELESSSLQAGMLCIIVKTKREDLVQERKLARSCSNQEHLNRLLLDLLPDNQRDQWREIRVTLSNLTPRFRPQVDLWQNKHPITEVNHPLHEASENLQKKFGFQVLQSGSEYSHSVPPRFAQEVYALRGISLP